MAKQLYYEDVNVGSEITPLKKHPTRRQLVMWAGASGDYYEIHYDKEFAKGQGLKDVIVHGRLKASFLMQMLTEWIGVDGDLYKFSVQHRAMDYPDEDLMCKGKVTNKYVKDGKHCVDCEVWTENPRREKTAPATATVILPSRA